MNARMLFLLAALLTTGAAPKAKELPDMIRLGSTDHELISTKITVSDLERSLAFYTRVVGLKPTDAADAEQARTSTSDFVEISLNQTGSRRDASLVLIRRKGDIPTPSVARMTWVAFKVPDVAAAINRVKAAGYEIRNEATAYQGVTFGIVYDPDGYTVEFLEAENAK